jgi:ParB family chromosome partitioning protein
MARAQFDKESTDLLPAAGSCAACPKRTANSPDLITDMETAREESELLTDKLAECAVPDFCTDPGCFSAKLTAHIVQIKSRLAAAGETPLDITLGYQKPKKGVLGRHDFKEVEAGTPGAKTAVVADGDEAGRVVHVKVNPSNGSSRKENAEALRLKRDREENQRTENELAVRRAILGAIGPKIGKLERADMDAIVQKLVWRTNAAEQFCQAFGIKYTEHRAGDALAKAIPSMPEVELYHLALAVTVSEDFDPWRVRGSKQAPAQLLALARRFKVDPVKIRGQIEDEQMEAQGGKRREVKKPALAKKKSAAVKKAKPAAKKSAAAKKAVAKAKGKKP